MGSRGTSNRKNKGNTKKSASSAPPTAPLEGTPVRATRSQTRSPSTPVSTGSDRRNPLVEQDAPPSVESGEKQDVHPDRRNRKGGFNYDLGTDVMSLKTCL